MQCRGMLAGMVGVAVAAATLAIAPTSAQALPGNCTTSAAVVKGGKGFNVDYRLKCDFLVEGIRMKANKSIVRVHGSPAFNAPTADDDSSLSCEKTKPRRGRCDGHVHEDTVIEGSLQVRRPCRKSRLTLDLYLGGGDDSHHGPSLLRPMETEKTITIRGCKRGVVDGRQRTEDAQPST
jgi:hypothetical protein